MDHTHADAPMEVEADAGTAQESPAPAAAAGGEAAGVAVDPDAGTRAESETEAIKRFVQVARTRAASMDDTEQFWNMLRHDAPAVLSWKQQVQMVADVYEEITAQLNPVASAHCLQRLQETLHHKLSTMTPAQQAKAIKQLSFEHKQMLTAPTPRPTRAPRRYYGEDNEDSDSQTEDSDADEIIPVSVASGAGEGAQQEQESDAVFAHIEKERADFRCECQFHPGPAPDGCAF